MAVFSIGNVLSQWQGAGVFDYLLPFLLIFAVLYAILSSTKFMGEKNKGVYIVLSLAIALLALQQGIVNRFFAPLFSQLSAGLAVLLVFVILIGLFMSFKNTDGAGGENYEKWFKLGFAVLGVLIAIIVVANSFADYGWGGSYYSNNAGWIVGGVLLLGVIVAVAVSKGN